MNAANKKDWKTKDFPQLVKELRYSRIFDKVELEQVRYGLIPMKMEDKWFIYYESETLNFHRSWSGYKIYQLTLLGSDDHTKVVSALVNRDVQEYQQQDDNQDMVLLNFLIDRLLLNKSVIFPKNENIEDNMQPLYEHSVIGHGRSNKEI